MTLLFLAQHEPCPWESDYSLRCLNYSLTQACSRSWMDLTICWARRSRPAFTEILRLRSIVLCLRPNCVQDRFVDGVGRAIAADHRRRVGFADTGGKRNHLRQSVGGQVPAIEFAVFTVGENRLSEGINRCGVDAPLLNSPRKPRSRIGCDPQNRYDLFHDQRAGDDWVLLGGRRVGNKEIVVSIEGQPTGI